jgi:hypothetical protein
VGGTEDHSYLIVMLKSYAQALADYQSFAPTDDFPVALVFSDGVVLIANDPPRAT